MKLEYKMVPVKGSETGARKIEGMIVFKAFAIS